jgi:hypothetical protein
VGFDLGFAESADSLAQVLLFRRVSEVHIFEQER